MINSFQSPNHFDLDLDFPNNPSENFNPFIASFNNESPSETPLLQPTSSVTDVLTKISRSSATSKTKWISVTHLSTKLFVRWIVRCSSQLMLDC